MSDVVLMSSKLSRPWLNPRNDCIRSRLISEWFLHKKKSVWYLTEHIRICMCHAIAREISHEMHPYCKTQGAPRSLTYVLASSPGERWPGLQFWPFRVKKKTYKIPIARRLYKSRPHTMRLMKVVNFVTRVVTGLGKFDHVSSARSDLGLHTPRQKCDSRIAAIAQKVCALGEPQELAQLFSTFSESPQYERIARQDRELRPPKTRTVAGRTALFCTSRNLPAKCDPRECAATGVGSF